MRYVQYTFRCDIEGCGREAQSQSARVPIGTQPPIYEPPHDWWWIRPPHGYGSVLVCGDHDPDEVTLAATAALELARR